MFHRLPTRLIKELQALLPDPQGRLLIVVPVILQMALFPFAATLEVKNNTLGVLNEDAGRESVELIQRLSYTKAFSEILVLRNETEMRRAIDEQKALLVLRI